MEKDIVTIAKICHEVNRVYCKSLGDNSQVPWDEAPDWQIESAVNGVVYHLQDDRTPEESHISWLAEKESTGWKYGPVKDVEKKEHPCCVPYDQLPKEQKLKDELFTAIVNAFK